MSFYCKVTVCHLMWLNHTVLLLCRENEEDVNIIIGTFNPYNKEGNLAVTSVFQSLILVLFLIFSVLNFLHFCHAYR